MTETIYETIKDSDGVECFIKRGNLVRCKECVHYRYYGLDSYPVSECKIDHEENPDEEWFCADGKREN